MKTVILLAIMVTAVSASAQTLKDALYGGKLKTDSGTVIRKGDDLSSKMDTTTKKLPDTGKTKAMLVARDSSITAGGDSSIVGLSTPTSSGVNTPEIPKETVAAPKDNNRIWKDYIDSITLDLKKEVLTSKKVKEGVYSVLIQYEIGIDGQITVNSVSASPESSFLEQQIKERITLSAPQLTPLLAGNGKPRVAAKKQMLTLAK
jgi:hypothetical protein